jgi:hypothetical protein
VRQLLETDDLAHLSFVEATLKAVGIRCYAFDDVSPLTGWEPAMQKRVMVADEDFDTARAALVQALRKHHK